MKKKNENTALQFAAMGECMIEYRRVNGEILHHGYAGDTCNTLVYVTRLLDAPDTTTYITALGDDSDSNAMIAQWESEGINTELVKRIPGKLPGSYTIDTDGEGERTFTYKREDAAVRSLFRVTDIETLLQSLADCRYFYLTGITLAIFSRDDREVLVELVRNLSARDITVIFDSNYRQDLWDSAGEAATWFNRIYPFTGMALAGYDDERAVFNDKSVQQTRDRLYAAGIREIVVKNGASPCTVRTEEGINHYPVEKKPAPVDTTAAGDSFNAAYIAARLCGYDSTTAIRASHRLASLVIRFPGAIIPREQTPQLPELISE